ncbi:response regulator [Azospirillum sp. HJ39]|uniref:response regulator n=1 Tax=Azospirillum sp. HJ39 TaxID=3159496 RepID=UPI003557610B
MTDGRMTGEREPEGRQEPAQAQVTTLLVAGPCCPPVRASRIALAFAGVLTRVETVDGALDRLRSGRDAAGTGVVLLDGDAATAEAVAALARLDPAPAVLVLLPEEGHADAAASIAASIAAGAQDVLAADDAVALGRAADSARLRQARENRLRTALAAAERGKAEAAALFEAAGAMVDAALDPMLALADATLDSLLLPSQHDRLTGLRTVGAALRATMSALGDAAGPALDETVTLAGLAGAANAMGTTTVTADAEPCGRFVGDGAGLRALLSVLTAEGGAVQTLALQPAGDAAELVLLRRGSPRLRPLVLAAARPLVRRLGGRLLAEGGVGDGVSIHIPVRPVETPAALSVLLVEDNPIGRLVAAGFFRALGHGVTTAEDGAQALAAATGGGFDLIVMDVQMPVMDGHEASRAIRALPGKAGRVPIVALTAGTDAADDARCRAAGMDDCLHKPLTMDRLRAVLERWFPGRVQAGGRAVDPE